MRIRMSKAIELMEKSEHDIAQFNRTIKSMVQELTANGEKTEDLFAHLMQAQTSDLSGSDNVHRINMDSAGDTDVPRLPCPISCETIATVCNKVAKIATKISTSLLSKLTPTVST